MKRSAFFVIASILASGVLSMAAIRSESAVQSGSASPAPSRTIQRSIPVRRAASSGIADILNLAKRGVDQSVLKSFAENYPVAYHPSADEIIALHDAGISSDVITALLRRTGELNYRQWEAAQRANAARTEARKVAEVPQNTVQTAAPQRTAPAYQVNYVYPASSWYPAYPAYYYNYSYALPLYYSSAYCYRPYRYSYSYWPRSYWPTWPSWPSYSAGVGFRSNYGVSFGFRSGYCGRGGFGYRSYPRAAGRYACR